MRGSVIPKNVTKIPESEKKNTFLKPEAGEYSR
jgi:hypothetical protein